MLTIKKSDIDLAQESLDKVDDMLIMIIDGLDLPAGFSQTSIDVMRTGVEFLRANFIILQKALPE